MSLMSRVNRGLIALGVAAVVGQAIPTQAAPIITVTPSPSVVVQNGTSQTFDVVVSGLALNEAVGGVSLLLTWDSTILGAPTSDTLDPDNKMGTSLDPFNVDPATGFAPGKLTLSFLADISKDEAALKALQGAGFRLATFSLTALALGTTPIDLLVFSPNGPNGVPLSDGNGFPLSATLVGTCVTVGVSSTVPPGSCAAVPEPASMMLIGSGLASVLALARRRQAARKA